MSTSSVALSLHNLTKRYGATRGIHDINLDVYKGEIFGFLGPNGAGKTTTINTILDILRPNTGTISILGYDHRNVKKTHRLIGYLAGDMETDPTLTGKQYLNYVAHLHGNVDPKRVSQLIERLKVETSVKIKHLSRGNRQKIGLVAALMHDPEILILDEPTSGLDPLIQVEFNRIIQEHKQAGKTAFISSHVLSEVQNICDRVGFIRDGQLISVSRLDELLHKASQTVTVTFSDTPPKQKLTTLKGVVGLTTTATTCHFQFSGDVNQLLAILAQHKIASLNIAEADLEELFMSYYTGKSNV